MKRAASKHTDKIISFGFGEQADVRAVDIITVAKGSLVTAKLGEKSLCFTVAAHGKHWVSNALAILAAVDAVGGDLASTGLALAELEGLEGRGKRHDLELMGGGKALLIDESYNANPVSMKATLSQLASETCNGKKIVILGAMGELGDKAQSFHEALAEDIASAGASTIILVGEEMGHTAAKLKDILDRPTEIYHAENSSDTLTEVAKNIGDGDILLIKGSNYLGLSKVVNALVGGEY